MEYIINDLKLYYENPVLLAVTPCSKSPGINYELTNLDMYLHECGTIFDAGIASFLHTNFEYSAFPRYSDEYTFTSYLKEIQLIAIMSFSEGFKSGNKEFSKILKNEIFPYDNKNDKSVARAIWRIIESNRNQNIDYEDVGRSFYNNGYKNGLLMQSVSAIVKRAELYIEYSEILKECQEENKAVLDNYTEILNNEDKFKDLFLSESLYRTALTKLSDYFTDNGILIKPNRNKTKLIAILYALKYQGYLKRTDYSVADIKKIAESILNDTVSQDTAKLRNRVQDTFKQFTKLLPKV